MSYDRLPPELVEKLAALRRQLQRHAPLLIAYSGGVDSAFLLAAATDFLGAGAEAIIADSPSLPRQALADAVALADRLGARISVIQTRELENPHYASNPVNRCYFCKAELFQCLERIARARGFRAIAYGENLDDMEHERPGRRAAEEFSVVAPLRDALLCKEEIRELSRRRALPTADQPAQPCLSSRIPHGTPVTAEALQMIERSEAVIRDLGFRVFRVRHLSDAGEDAPRARVQIAPEEMSAFAGHQATVKGRLQGIGYREVEFDPEGYRSPR